MTGRPTQLVKPSPQRLSETDRSSRIIPLAIAGLLCFLLAIMMGSTAGYIFRMLKKPALAAISNVPESTPEVNVAETSNDNTNTTAGGAAELKDPVAAPVPALPDGTVEVPGGEVVLAGDEKRPLQRFMVERFAVGETEVTNAEYSNFVRETGHEPPPGWNGHQFPRGTDNLPVVNVSWKDANDFCKWKSTKIGFPVRLPTEAEWELAARGTGDSKYPWGNEWSNEAAVSKETGGKVSLVKSRPVNRSPFGAYDMVGNVWEWVSDEVGTDVAVTDDQVESARKQGRTLKLVKGGSAEESSSDMSARSRYEVPQSTKVKVIGFRYVISLKN